MILFQNSCKICAEMGNVVLYIQRYFSVVPQSYIEVSILENLLLQMSVYNIFAHFYLNLCINLKALMTAFNVLPLQFFILI